jgi:hypothetical protein
MNHTPFDEARFKQKLDKALQVIETVLENTRQPTLPADVSHSYDDKFLLAEYLTNTALAAQVQCLEYLGVTDFNTLKEWAKSRTVTLRLKSEERCIFDKKTKRKADSSTSLVTEVAGIALRSHRVRDKTTEYHWKVDVTYELFAFQGQDPEQNKVPK